MAGKRVDPETGAAVTYRQLVATYKKDYNTRQIQDQGWVRDGSCKNAQNLQDTSSTVLSVLSLFRNTGRYAGRFAG